MIKIKAVTDESNGQKYIWKLNKRWHWSSSKKLPQSSSQTHGWVAQLVREPEWNLGIVASNLLSTVICKNSLVVNAKCTSYFCYTQCDYLCKILIKVSVATDESNDQNKIWTLNKIWNWNRCAKIVGSYLTQANFL